MRSGAMAVGIIGGIFALFIGLLGFTIGQIGGASGADGAAAVQALSLGVPVAAIVGAAVVKSKPAFGGILMIASAVTFLVVLQVHILSLLPAVPLAIAGVLGLAASAETA